MWSPVHQSFVPEFQSAYRNFHSTETALLRTRNDILINMNKHHVTLLVFQYLSAAFDTVDHDILLRRLKYKFGICDNALAWYRSYLVNRSQRVVIENVTSNSFDMKYGVPQGSCLGSLLFILYTSKLLDVIHHHLPLRIVLPMIQSYILHLIQVAMLLMMLPSQLWKIAYETSGIG